MKKIIKTKKQGTVLRQNITHWVCQETGEVLEANEILKPIGRNGFMITYMTEIIKLIETIGNKKMQVVKFVMENMDTSSNSLIITTREIAAKSGISHKTVIETLKILEDAEIIQRRTGAIMIKPTLVHKGNENKERALITRFYKFSGEAEEEPEQ